MAGGRHPAGASALSLCLCDLTWKEGLSSCNKGSRNEVILDYLGGPKPMTGCPHRRSTKERPREKTKPCADGGGPRREAATSQGTLGQLQAMRGEEGVSPRSCRQTQPGPHLDFRCLEPSRPPVLPSASDRLLCSGLTQERSPGRDGRCQSSHSPKGVSDPQA